MYTINATGQSKLIELSTYYLNANRFDCFKIGRNNLQRLRTISDVCHGFWIRRKKISLGGPSPAIDNVSSVQKQCSPPLDVSVAKTPTYWSYIKLCCGINCLGLLQFI